MLAGMSCLRMEGGKLNMLTVSVDGLLSPTYPLTSVPVPAIRSITDPAFVEWDLSACLLRAGDATVGDGSHDGWSSETWFLRKSHPC